jgi:hypothetical protein
MAIAHLYHSGSIGNSIRLPIDPILVKQFKCYAIVAKKPDPEIKDSAKIKFEDVKKIVIRPIELCDNKYDSTLQLKNDNETKTIFEISLTRITDAVEDKRKTTYRLRGVTDLQIKIQFLDEDQNSHSMILNVEDKYVKSICAKIAELNSVNSHRYWLRRNISYNLAGSIKTVTIFPKTPFLGKNEEVLWSNEKLDEITNKTITKLEALTNFRVFEYDFKKHEGHYLFVYDVKKIVVINKKWISHKKNDSDETETSIVGDIKFISPQGLCIAFSEIRDPSTLTRLLKSAKDLFIRHDRNMLTEAGKVGSNMTICTQCGYGNSNICRYCNHCGSKILFVYFKCGHINPEAANFCNKCDYPR